MAVTPGPFLLPSVGKTRLSLPAVSLLLSHSSLSTLDVPVLSRAVGGL